MYTPIDTIWEEHSHLIKKYQNSWEDDYGGQFKHVIIENLKLGQFEPTPEDVGIDPIMLDNPDFKHEDIEKLKKDDLDLKGISIKNESFSFHDKYRFPNLDLSYSLIEHCAFENCLINAQFNLSTLKNCIFRNCTLDLTNFAASKIEACRFTSCEFGEDTIIDNCLIINSTFDSAKGDNPIFQNCKFL